ncbi:MAG TPA: hypothetical protein VMK84_29720, partial [Streptosporangiaceae bacterium]|nr:hypothetical protein [Streptosporangiaceae bacterium]
MGTSSWGSGSAFARPSLSSPRFSVPFWPVAGRGAVVAARDAVPVRAEADVVPLLGRAEAEAADRPLAVLARVALLRVPLAAVLAAPDAGRAEACPDEPVL